MMIRKKYFYILVACILLIALSFRCYKVGDKYNMFYDEYVTILIANYTDAGWISSFVEPDRIYTGEEVKEILYSDDNSFKGVSSDIYSLRKDVRDDAHTNLHYSLVKLSFLGADTSDMDVVMYRGIGLNIVLFLLGFLFMFKLLRLFYKDNYILVICALVIVFISPAALGNTLYMREYALQETLFIIISYLVTLAWLKIHKNEKWNAKDFIALAFASALLALSGYFIIGYLLLLGFVTLMYSYKYRRFNKGWDVLFVLGVLVVAVFLIFLIYPSFTNGLVGDRVAQTGEMFGFESFKNNAIETLIELSRQIKAYYMSVPVAVFLLLAVCVALWKIKHLKIKLNVNQMIQMCLIGCSLVWILVVLFLAPYKAIRYIVAALPIVSLVFPLVCELGFKSKVKGVLIIVFACMFVGQTLCIRDDLLFWSRRKPNNSFNVDTQTPLIILGVHPEWMKIALTPYFTDGRNVQFVYTLESFSEIANKHDNVYVVFEKKFDDIVELPGYMRTVDMLDGDTGWLFAGFKLTKELEEEVFIEDEY